MKEQKDLIKKANEQLDPIWIHIKLIYEQCQKDRKVCDEVKRFIEHLNELYHNARDIYHCDGD